MANDPDADEKKLSELAKRMLTMPPKRRDEVRLGKSQPKEPALRQIESAKDAAERMAANKILITAPIAEALRQAGL